MTWHIFRYTFATRLVQQGVDIMTIRNLLGHSTIVMTMRYAHGDDQAKRITMQALNGAGLVAVPKRVA